MTTKTNWYVKWHQDSKHLFIHWVFFIAVSVSVTVFLSNQINTAYAIDNAPPTVSITSPVNGTTVSGTLVITASATDDIAIASVEFKLDGITSLGIRTKTPYSISVNSTTIANGTHQLTAIAKDTSNNFTTSTPVSIVVNNTAVPTATFSASPTSITSGASSTLTWSTTNATSVSINQGVGVVALSGTRVVSPTTTTTYTLTAVGSTTITSSVTVTVGSSTPPPTATFTVSPTNITSGQSATLTWSTTNTTSVSINQGIGSVALSGTRVVSPTTTTTYTLTAVGTSTITRTVTVTVTAGVPVTEANQRYLVWNEWNFYTGEYLPDFQNRIDLVKSKGFNAVRFQIFWPSLETSPGVYDWSAFDQKLDYVVSSGLKPVVSFNANIFPDGSILPNSDLMYDSSGNVFTGGFNSSSMISFSSNTALTKTAATLQAITSHYNSRYAQGTVLFYQITFSPYGETEYWPSLMLDYSTQAKGQFRNWLTQKYGTIENMNATLSTNFSSFAVVEPPTTFSGNYGLAWYQFRSDKLKAAIDLMSDTVKSVNSNLKFGIQVGSVWDWGAASRGTILFDQIASKADWITVDDGPSYNHKFSADYLRSNLPGKNLGNEIDSVSNPGATDQAYITQGQQTYDRGLRFLSVANWSSTDLINHASVINALAPYLQQGTPNIVTSGSMSVSAKNLIWSGSDNYLFQFNALSGSGVQLLNISLTNDIPASIVSIFPPIDSDENGGTVNMDAAQGFSTTIGAVQQLMNKGDNGIIGGAPDTAISVEVVGSLIKTFFTCFDGLVQLSCLSENSSVNSFSNLSGLYKNKSGKFQAVLAGKVAGDPYESQYAAMASTWRDPATGIIHGWYHSEIPVPGCGNGPYWASIGYAISTDGGRTFTKQPSRAITSPYPVVSGLCMGQGTGEPKVVESGNYLYMIFDQSTNDLNYVTTRAGLAIARASKSSPNNWSKYYNGGFTEAGVGGMDTPIIATGSNGQQPWSGFVTWNSYLNKFVMLHTDYNHEGSVYLRTSDDLISWTNPSLLFSGSSNHNYRYATLIGTTDDVMGQSGYVYFGRHPKTGYIGTDTLLTRRSISFQIPSAPAPTATFSVSPSSINAGQPTTLSWTTTNATSVSIDQGIGTVASSGSMQVSPSTTTTYTLTVAGTGTITKSVTITVSGTLSVGYTDGVSSSLCNISGWAKDDDNAVALQVDVYRSGPIGSGGVFVGSTTANLPRGDNLLGYTFTFPSGFNDTFYAYALGVDANGNAYGQSSLLPIYTPNVPTRQLTCN